MDPVRVLDPITVGCHDLGYGAVVFSGDCPESVPRLYGIGQIRGGVFHDRSGDIKVSLFSGAAVVSFILLYDIVGVVAGNDGSRVLRPFCLEGHGVSGFIRVKVPFCFRTVVIIIPAFNTMPLFGGNGIRCGECHSVLAPIHFLGDALIFIVRFKSDHEHTVQGGFAEITA